MNNDRKYQRYTISQSGNTSDQPEVFIEKELVRLVDFSVGGFFVVSESRPSGDEINISVKFGNSGKIDLVGRVVRVKRDGDMWGIAIDVSKNYNLDTLKEV
ncbi:MAG: PilZ domain-containing protein [Pseudomonadota bacterium]